MRSIIACKVIIADKGSEFALSQVKSPAVVNKATDIKNL
ncbi:MAG: hypothetical protein ACI93V_001322 [Alteromonadaceae bacterium]|jgi:hypothetical protein|tara:strand:+ start:2990 stop:3106 length:117 start_codon:yes stop_codon:yes gene_type:complete